MHFIMFYLLGLSVGMLGALLAGRERWLRVWLRTPPVWKRMPYVGAKASHVFELFLLLLLLYFVFRHARSSIPDFRLRVTWRRCSLPPCMVCAAGSAFCGDHWGLVCIFVLFMHILIVYCCWSQSIMPKLVVLNVVSWRRRLRPAARHVRIVLRN